MKIIIPLLFILSSCVSVDQYESIARPVVEQLNDRILDRAHKIICNDTYRSEMDFIIRRNITADTFRKFCARGKGETR